MGRDTEREQVGGGGQRDRAARDWGRGRERETQNLKQAPGSELSAQSLTQGSVS